mmetsp:Transcript_1938/g.6962  ORF Transcript_1938/g.6962 Transcript_1938/m.6962 type:complete len:301 (-) Transcript_1938:1199-2101(-)
MGRAIELLSSGTWKRWISLRSSVSGVVNDWYVVMNVFTNFMSGDLSEDSCRMSLFKVAHFSWSGPLYMMRSSVSSSGSSQIGSMSGTALSGMSSLRWLSCSGAGGTSGSGMLLTFSARPRILSVALIMLSLIDCDSLVSTSAVASILVRVSHMSMRSGSMAAFMRSCEPLSVLDTSAFVVSMNVLKASFTAFAASRIHCFTSGMASMLSFFVAVSFSVALSCATVHEATLAAVSTSFVMSRWKVPTSFEIAVTAARDAASSSRRRPLVISLPERELTSAPIDCSTVFRQESSCEMTAVPR